MEIQVIDENVTKLVEYKSTYGDKLIILTEKWDNDKVIEYTINQTYSVSGSIILSEKETVQLYEILDHIFGPKELKVP